MSLYLLAPYLGTLRSSRARMPDRIDNFSPASLPITRIAIPTRAFDMRERERERERGTRQSQQQEGLELLDVVAVVVVGSFEGAWARTLSGRRMISAGSMKRSFAGSYR